MNDPRNQNPADNGVGSTGGSALLWQPIQTAPTDGTEILASDGMAVQICHCEPDMMMRWRFGDGGHDAFEATHWVPLPPPPNAKAQPDAQNL